MSVLVKGMKMPECCGDCKAFVCYRQWAGDPGDCFCGITKSDAEQNKRNDDCPLIEVPPHTRLIDANALMNEFKILQSGREIFGMELDSSFLDSSQEISTEWYRVEETLEDAPTIIEAEEGE